MWKEQRHIKISNNTAALEKINGNVDTSRALGRKSKLSQRVSRL
jgi:hypothetical protein